MYKLSIFFSFSCLALQFIPPRTEPPAILPRVKGTVSKTTPTPENQRPGLPDAKPVPPEPKKRAHRKPSITNSEKDVEPLLNLKQSMLKENNEDQKGIQPVKSMEKDSDLIQSVTQRERNKQEDIEVYQ